MNDRVGLELGLENSETSLISWNVHFELRNIGIKLETSIFTWIHYISFDNSILTWKPPTNLGDKIPFPNEYWYFQAKSEVFMVISLFPSCVTKVCFQVNFKSQISHRPHLPETLDNVFLMISFPRKKQNLFESFCFWKF